MANNLPLFLVAEVRHAFRQCAQQNKGILQQQFSSVRLKQFRATLSKPVPRARNTPSHDSQVSSSFQNHDSRSARDVEKSNPASLPAELGRSRELVPQARDGRAVGTDRTTDAPMKIIPKADVTPNLRLTPKERLHIEILTRRAPPVIKQIKPYKERLLIYHHGYLTENALIFLKVLGLVCAGVTTLIIVPAHYTAGSPLWLCGSLFLGGLFPSFFFHYLLKPLVTRIHLRLPPNARVSPESAMKYAKSLPHSAQIDVSFTRITSLPGTVTINVADLHPIPHTGRWPWQVANIRWVGRSVDRGSRLRPNPTEFCIKPSVGAGRARRDVIPGIWPEIHKRLTSMTKEQVSRWKKA